MIIELTIRYDDQTGACNANGPLANKLVCYGMLEMARDIVNETATKAMNAKIVGVAGGALPFHKS
jgi:hypothetical protein